MTLVEKNDLIWLHINLRNKMTCNTYLIDYTLFNSSMEAVLELHCNASLGQFWNQWAIT